MGKVSSPTNSQKTLKKVDIKDDPLAGAETRKKSVTEVTGIQSKGTGHTGGSEYTTFSEYMEKNKLKFQPKRATKPSMLRTKITVRKLAPEFVYMIDSYCSCILAIFQIFLAVCLIAWQGSIQSILSDISKLGGLGELLYNQTNEKKRYVIETFANSQYHAYRSGFLSGDSLGAALIAVALISIINTIVGWKAAMMAMRRTLIVHRYFDLPLAIMNVAAIAWGFLASDCLLEMDIIERSLMENFMNYGDRIQSDSMINAIQQALGCCGVHGPMDYMDANIRVNLSENKSFEKFPTSCCREWWIRNVECGLKSVTGIQPGSSLYDRILFTETIQQVGCIERISEVCSLFFPLYKYGMLVSFILYLIHIVIRYYTVVRMLREESAIRGRAVQEVRDHARIGFPLWSGANSMESSDEDDVSLNKASQLKYKETITTMMDHDSKPTSIPDKSKKKFIINQDTLQYYKDRAEFAEIESKLARSYLGDWIEMARDTSKYATERAYSGDDEIEEYASTAPARTHKKHNKWSKRTHSFKRGPTLPPLPLPATNPEPEKKKQNIFLETVFKVEKPESWLAKKPAQLPENLAMKHPPQNKNKPIQFADSDHFTKMKQKLIRDRAKREQEAREQEEKERYDLEEFSKISNRISSTKQQKKSAKKKKPSTSAKREQEAREQEEKERYDLEELTKFSKRESTSKQRKKSVKKKKLPTSNKVLPHYVQKLKPFHQKLSSGKTNRKSIVNKDVPYPKWLGKSV